MSLGLGKRRVDLVPEGEVSTSIRFPQGTYDRLTLHWGTHDFTLVQVIDYFLVNFTWFFDDL